MRKLSGYEATILYRSILDIYTSFMVGADYPIELSEQLILSGLSKLCNQHPVFSLSIKRKDMTVDYMDSWIPTESLIEVYADENDEVEEIMKEYQTYKFDYDSLNQPLWKLILVKNTNSLILLTDHTFMDGTAARNFHSEFLECLSNVDDALTIDLVDTTKFDEYPDPTIEMNFQQRVASGSSLPYESVISELNPALFTLPMQRHKTKQIFLSKKQSQRLIDKAHKENVKLTALIYKIASSSVPLPKDGIKATMIPINSKRDRKFGMFFGKYFHTQNTSALEFQNLLMQNIPYAMNDYEVFETTYKKTPEISYQSMVDLKKRNNRPKTTLAISNLGILAGNFTGKVYFDQPMVDTNFSLHLCSTSNGMVLNCSSHRAVKQEDFDQYVENVKSFL